jgi:predicted GTPase
LLLENLREVKSEAKVNQELLKFYIAASLLSKRFDEFFSPNTTLVDENGEKRFINELLSTKDYLFIVFPYTACPTCYNITSFSELSKNENMPDLVIIAHIESFSEIRTIVRDIELPSSVFAYEDANEILLDNSNVFMFLWNSKQNEIQYKTYVPKQINKTVVEYYSKIISSKN